MSWFFFFFEKSNQQRVCHPEGRFQKPQEPSHLFELEYAPSRSSLLSPQQVKEGSGLFQGKLRPGSREGLGRLRQTRVPGSPGCCLRWQAADDSSTLTLRSTPICMPNAPCPGWGPPCRKFFVAQRVEMGRLAAGSPLQRARTSHTQRGGTACLRGWAQPSRGTRGPCLFS